MLISISSFNNSTEICLRTLWWQNFALLCKQCKDHRKLRHGWHFVNLTWVDPFVRTFLGVCESSELCCQDLWQGIQDYPFVLCGVQSVLWFSVCTLKWYCCSLSKWANFMEISDLYYFKVLFYVMSILFMSNNSKVIVNYIL